MVLYVHCSFAIILIGKRELVVLLSLSSWCLLVVIWLFLAVPWVCLQFAIVVLPVHTHLLFFAIISLGKSCGFTFQVLFLSCGCICFLTFIGMQISIAKSCFVQSTFLDVHESKNALVEVPF